MLLFARCNPAAPILYRPHCFQVVVRALNEVTASYFSAETSDLAQVRPDGESWHWLCLLALIRLHFGVSLRARCVSTSFALES